MAETVRSKIENLSLSGPQTRDELHAWVVTELGVDIPRVSVCPDHDAPFDFFADLFFEEVGSAFAIANRGGGKTQVVAILHVANSIFKPGVESLTFASENQSKRCYDHVKNFLAMRKYEDVLGEPMQSKTLFKSGAKVEIVTATVGGLNGPHHQKAHADEVEIMHEAAWKESRKVAKGKVVHGRRFRAQNIGTSTRKYKHGRVQKIVNECKQAEKRGHIPPWTIYVWCLFETAAEVSNCRVVKPELEENEKCQCHRAVKDTWDDRSERNLMQVCRGRFAESRGYTELDEVTETFLQDDRSSWESQIECREASSEGLYIPRFSRERHGISTSFMPVAANGPIYQSVDWGSTNPASVHWYQKLKRPVQVTRYSDDTSIILPKDSLVCFDEIYDAELGNIALGRKVLTRETEWSARLGRPMVIRDRFPDPQNKGAREDWKKELGMKTIFRADRSFDEQVKDCRTIVHDGKFFVVVDNCPMFCEEIEVWREENGHQVDKFNHAMSDFRYCGSNVKVTERRDTRDAQSEAPGAEKSPNTDILASAAEGPGSEGGRRVGPRREEWRSRIATAGGMR